MLFSGVTCPKSVVMMDFAVASDRVFWSAHCPKYFLPFATKAAFRLLGEAAREVKSVTGAAATKPVMVLRIAR